MSSNLFYYDYYRATGKEYRGNILDIYKYHHLIFLWFLRKYFERGQPTLLKYILLWLMRLHGIEIVCPNIGRGLLLVHAYNININWDAVIGDNCTIFKGATIGKENRGAREGCPTIGNNVWIGANATVVGKITIGDDVLIAPNSFVNRDIPAHSVVVGNPCVIRNVDNATAGYIYNEITDLSTH